MRGAGTPRGRRTAATALLGALLLLLLGAPGCDAARASSIAVPVTDDLLALARRHLQQAPATCTAAWGPSFNQSCMFTDSGKPNGVTCSAKELTITSARLENPAYANDPSKPLVSAPCCNGVGNCTLCNDDEVLTGTLNLTIVVNAATRFNLGLWVAEAGSRPCSLNGQRPDSLAACPDAFAKCTKNAFIPSSPFGDNDTTIPDRCCGDLGRGTWSNILIPGYRLACRANFTVTQPGPAPACGGVNSNLDWCLGWDVNANSGSCEVTSANRYANAGTDVPSKCDCGVAQVGGLQVYTPTCADIDLNPNTPPVPFPCPAPSYVANPNRANWTSPTGLNRSICCTFNPTCSWPTEGAPSAPWSCPPGTLVNSSAANASNPSDSVCCLPTCGRRNVSVAGAWPCTSPLVFNSSATSITPPSNAACCFTPTCGRPNATVGTWTCPAPTVYNSSAAAVAPPSNAACCFTPTCGRPNATVGTWTCPAPTVYNSSAAAVAPPSNAVCCFTPTCGRPNATVVGNWSCPPPFAYNSSAAGVTPPSDAACCLFTPTCGRPNATVVGNWSCPSPFTYNSSAAGVTPPSDAACCLFTPTCGRPNATVVGNWSCPPPFTYNSSAAAVAPPSDAACCLFTPVCAQQSPSVPYNLSWACPPRSEPLVSEANTPANASNFNDICCTAQAAIPPQVNLTASGDKRGCGLGQILTYQMTATSFGAGNASNVVLTNTYTEPGLTYINASCPGAGGSCTYTPEAPTSSGLVVCELGRMNPVIAITCTFTVSLSQALPVVFEVAGSLDVFDDDGNQLPPDTSTTASLVLSTVNCTGGEVPVPDGDNCTCVVPPVPAVALTVPSRVCTNNVAARVPYTLVVSSVGTADAPFVVLTSAVKPPGLVLTDAFALCRWPNGTVVTGDNPLLGCTVTPAPDAETSFSVECVLGAIPAGTNISCTFQPLASPAPGWGSSVFTVDALVTLYEDSSASTALDPGGVADGSFNATLSKCPPYEAYNNATCGCTVLDCNPCGTANPTVFFTTGTSGVPQNSLWQVRNFALSNYAQQAQFICQIVGMTAGATTGDIALLWDGSILVLDTAGALGYIPVARLPAPSAGPVAGWTSTTTVPTSQRCTLLPLFKFDPVPGATGDGYTGLANAFSSDEFWASTGRGYVRNIFLNASNTNAGGVSGEEGDLVDYQVGTNPRNPLTQNTGGTDLTAGPDGNVYRWAAMQNTNPMNYTGTRLLRNPLGFTRDWQFVSDGAVNQNDVMYGANTLANAGAFCTSRTVIGTAFVTAGNGAAGFLEFGYSNGAAWTSPLPINTYLSPTATTPVLRRAKLVAMARSINNVASALRINGAAVKPVCTFPNTPTSG